MLILESMQALPPRLGALLLTRPAAVLGAVLFVIGTAFLLDTRVRRWATEVQSAGLDGLVGVLNPIGSGVTLLAVCVALALSCRALRRPRLCEAGWLGALAFMSAGLVEYALKHLVGRPRPAAAGPFLGPELDSFPSGHATSVFAVATVLGSFYPRLRWPLYTLAAAIALGRVYLARHYLSDIVAGALLGLVVASLVLRHRNSTVASSGPAV
jgi:membrane-associated phospholipid phosphatase